MKSDVRKSMPKRTSFFLIFPRFGEHFRDPYGTQNPLKNKKNTSLDRFFTETPPGPHFGRFSIDFLTFVAVLSTPTKRNANFKGSGTSRDTQN